MTENKAATAEVARKEYTLKKPSDEYPDDTPVLVQAGTELKPGDKVMLTPAQHERHKDICK